MWLFAMFDLPVLTKEQRKAHTQFRKAIKKEGFHMLQLSIYVRYCPSEESATASRNHVRALLPAEGQVRVLAVTDIQFGKMENYVGKNRAKVEDPPLQMLLF